jgi:hypothetical protein
MSRVVDPTDVKVDDRAYLLTRPWMMDEFRRQGYEAEMDAVAKGVKIRKSPEEESKLSTEDLRVGTQAPQQLDARPSGSPVDEDDVDYSEWSVADLKAEIDARNAEEGRSEKLPSNGNKATLVAALEADDLAEASA